MTTYIPMIHPVSGGYLSLDNLGNLHSRQDMWYICCTLCKLFMTVQCCGEILVIIITHQNVGNLLLFVNGPLDTLDLQSTSSALMGHFQLMSSCNTCYMYMYSTKIRQTTINYWQHYSEFLPKHHQM